MKKLNKNSQARQQTKKIYTYLKENTNRQTDRGSRRNQPISDNTINTDRSNLIESSRKRRKADVTLASKIRRNIEDNSCYDASTSNKSTEDIPDTLEDLYSEDDDDSLLTMANTQTACKIDHFLESEQIKRVQMENELRIDFECPLYDCIGSLNQIFRLHNMNQLRKLCSGAFSALELMFIASPSSKLRIMLFEHIYHKAYLNGLQVKFYRFLTLISYVFQIKPEEFCKFDVSESVNINVSLEQMVTTFAHLRVEDNIDRVTVQNENIYLLLDCWTFFRFSNWQDDQIISLLYILSRIYLDTKIRNIRCRVSYAFQMVINQLLNNPNKVNIIINNFVASGHLLRAADNIPRALSLFSLFIQINNYFNINHKLTTVRNILIFVTTSCINNANKDELTLGNILSLLPQAVIKLKEQERLTELYLVYTRLIDELTIDQQMLTLQDDQSLQIALNNYQEACACLNKRNINDKMIDIWARSLHRIKEALQNRQNLLKLELRLLNKNNNTINSSSDDEQF